MAVKILKRYFSRRFAFFQSNVFLNIPCDSRHKSYLLAFWNFNFKISKRSLKLFVNMEANVSENFKTLLLKQLWFYFNQACFLWHSSQKLATGILKFQILRDWNLTFWPMRKFQMLLFFQPNLFYVFPVTVLINVTYSVIEIFFFIFFYQKLKFLLKWKPMEVKISKRSSSSF